MATVPRSPGKRLAEGGLVPARDIDEGRRPGPAVEVLVAAADRQIGPGPVEVERHRPGAVREVPEDERPPRVRRARHGCQVVHGPRPVVHVRQHHHRHLAVDGRRDLGAVHEAQGGAPAEEVREPLGRVKVGREVVPLGKDDRARRQVDPPGGVPAPDEAVTPLAPGDLRQARGRRARQGAEGVAPGPDSPVRR